MGGAQVKTRNGRGKFWVEWGLGRVERRERE